LPVHCSNCGGQAGSRVYQEASVPLEAGLSWEVNTRQSRLCGKCFPIVVAELRKNNAGMARLHNMNHPKLAYSYRVDEEGIGSRMVEAWEIPE
jgi:hypothetical protein